MFITQQPNTISLRIQRDAISLLYGNTYGSLIVTFCVCIAFVFGFPENPTMKVKLFWLAFMNVVFFIRYLDMRHWAQNLKSSEYKPNKPLRRFLVLRYCSSLGLSAYTIIFFNSMTVVELSCTLVVLSALAGGGNAILAANRLLAYSYPFILLLPVSVMCLLSDNSYQHIYGVLGIVFIGVLLSSAKGSVKFTGEALLTKNQHSDLLSELEVKNHVISNANIDLEKKVKKRTEQIFELSNIDPLTKLFNRTAFVENLESLIRCSSDLQSQLAVLFIDLDGFKVINDSHGHGVGDKVLIETAKRLQGQINEKQSLCRWGGDEFLIVLQNNTSKEAYKFAETLIFKLSKTIHVDDHKLSVGATIGIAMFPEHSKNGTQLIALADTAMYAQKQTNKSSVRVFTKEMREALNREIALKNGLGSAIKNNELFVVFQPVIDSQTQTVSFCEALLRWELNGKLIPPDEFIPVAEQHGSINLIGAWVLHKACELASQWGFEKTVALSVNVSVGQLMEGNIAENIKSALSHSSFPAAQLHIEITESIFAEDIDYVLSQIKTIQDMGVKISIDDFGTGFSSLALLQSLSADIVKIDRNFVSSFESGGKAIIQATQHIAKDLGFSVVVEGVETKEQAQNLSLMGVDCLQGYHFCKPMKAEELPAWYASFKNEQR